MINFNQSKNFYDTFIKQKYVYVPGFFDEVTMDIVSNYAEFCLKRKTWGTANDDALEQSKYSFYSDPLVETLLLKSTDIMCEITQKRLAPTYSYIRIYQHLDELFPHTDRESCEYSVSVNVFSKKVWPILLQDLKNNQPEPSSFNLVPGDAVVYKGCDVHHWREKMIDKDNFTVQIHLHYVNLDGPYVNYKYDRRPGLGYSNNARKS